MQAGWVALSEDCVYGLSGCHPAKVYFRRCSDRCEPILLNRWVAALDRKGEVLGVLAEDEFEDLLVYADKLPGLGQALEGVIDR